MRLIILVLLLSGCAGKYRHTPQAQRSMQNFADYLNSPSSGQQTQQQGKNCETRPVTDYLSGEVIRYDTVCY